MSLLSVPNWEKSFEKPSSKTLNVGAPTFFEVRKSGSPFYGVSPIDQADDSSAFSENRPNLMTANALHKPSETTLNVGAPTFFIFETVSGPFVIAELQIGHTAPSRGMLAGLKTVQCTKHPSHISAVAQ